MSILLSSVVLLGLCSCGTKPDKKSNRNNDLKDSVNSSEGFTDDQHSHYTESNYDSTETTSNSEETINISDNPLFVEKGSTVDAFTLYQYDIDTGEKKKIFHFRNMEYDEQIGQWIYLQHYALTNYSVIGREPFDSKYERIAVEWYIEFQKEHHVGWVDREGHLTDITELIQPQSDDFSSLSPIHTSPSFDAKDRFVFYDMKENSLFYFDEEKKEKTLLRNLDTTPIISSSGEEVVFDKREYKIPYEYDLNNQLGFYRKMQYTDGVYGNSMIRDYKAYEGGFTYFTIINGAIYHGGTGLTPVIENDGRKEYKQSNNVYTDELRLTPQSEWKICEMVYGHDTIVFKADNDGKEAIFKMSYSDGKAGKPEKIQDIEKGSGTFYRWDKRNNMVRAEKG